MSTAVACPRCGKPAQVREHAEITPKLLAQPFYFARWYYCTNLKCQTKMFSREEDKVWNQPQLRRGDDVAMDVVRESERCGDEPSPTVAELILTSSPASGQLLDIGPVLNWSEIKRICRRETKVFEAPF